MYASSELQIGHVFDGNLWIPKKSCFLAFPIYWPVRNFRTAIFCGSVTIGLDQKLLESSLSIFGFIVYLAMFGNLCAIVTKFFRSHVCGCMFPNI